MPRTARIMYPGGLFHIVSRCLHGEGLLSGHGPRDKYLELLGKNLRKTDAKIHAWCIMPDHVHLVVRAGNDPLDKFLKPLHVGFAIWRNRRYGRTGPVFAARYKAILVDDKKHLLDLVRYVHLNPVRTGDVSLPEMSSWSSHRAYLGRVEPPQWLSMTPVLYKLDRNQKQGRDMFTDFVRAGLEEGHRTDLYGKTYEILAFPHRKPSPDNPRYSVTIAGGENFINQVRADIHALHAPDEPKGKYASKKRWSNLPKPPKRPFFEEVVMNVCLVMKLERREFDTRPRARQSAKARRAITWIWIGHYQGTQAEVAEGLNTGAYNVSRWLKNALDNFSEIEDITKETIAQLD